MITGISIENFKGIRERVEIELRPLTLLFGANSAGKSTLLHALQLARELFCRQRTAMERFGGGLDLGGFENFISDRDPNKTLTLRFELDLQSTNFLQEWRVEEFLIQVPGRPQGEQEDLSALGDEIRKGFVEVMIQGDADRNLHVVCWTVGYDGEPLARVKRGQLTHLNVYHPLILWPERADREISKLDSLNPAILPLYASEFVLSEPVTEEELRSTTEERLTRTNFDEGGHRWNLRRGQSQGLGHKDLSVEADTVLALREDGRCLKRWGFLCLAEGDPHFAATQADLDRLVHATLEAERNHLNEQKPTNKLVRPGFEDDLYWADTPSFDLVISNILASGLPNLHQGLAIKFNNELMTIRDGGKDELRFATQNRVLLGLLNRLLIVPIRVLRDSLEEIRFVGPIRDAIPRNFAAMRGVEADRWYSGLAAWDELHRNQNELVRQVSQWMGESDRLDTGYELRRTSYRELPVENPISAKMTAGSLEDADPDEMSKWLERLPTKSRVDLVHADSGLLLHPADVGQGVTQMIPVIAAAIAPGATKGCVVAIEQPELHLNPRQQAAIGDVFISSALQDPRHRFILETHSEHLILRIQRRIRESTLRHRKDKKESGPLPQDRVPSNDPLALDVRDIDVGVYYVEQKDGATKFELMPLDVSGDFIMPWPDDFFEIDFYERFGHAG